MASLTRGLQLLAAAVRYALAGAGLVTPPLLSRPTPCAEWDLELLVDHVSDSAGVLHQAITAGCAGPPPSDGPPGLDPVRGLRRQTTRLLATCTAAGPVPRLVVIGDRELTTNMLALAGALEITVHGWDISAACCDVIRHSYSRYAVGANQPAALGISAPADEFSRRRGSVPGERAKARHGWTNFDGVHGAWK